MQFRQRFTEKDLSRIKTAVKEAEDKISGEIVPVIVERSGQYTLANYKSSILFASFAFVLMVIIDRYIVVDASNNLIYDPLFIFVIVALAGIIGGLLPSLVGPVKRMLVSQQQLDVTTRQRAENAFLQEEVFNTRQRTGIMIFISFFEHEVIVMADKGINRVVEQKQWDKIVSDLVAQIRAGKIVDGLESAIKHCGQLLLEKGFYKTEDDTNELGDDLRING
jgi:putative membrane protein